jgi:hypothetical protein
LRVSTRGIESGEHSEIGLESIREIERGMVLGGFVKKPYFVG